MAGSRVAVLAGAAPQRLWALSDGQVGAAMTALGQASAQVESLLVTVLAEARSRGLSTSEGWGSVDWAKAHAPTLSTRAVLDLDTVAAAVGEPRLAEVVGAVTDVSTPDDTDTDQDQTDHDQAGGDTADAGASDAPGSGVLPVGKAAQIVRFHRSVRGLADPLDLEQVAAHLLAAARGPGGLTERQLGVAIRHAGA